MKFCKYCKEDLFLEQFNKHKSTKDGYNNKCKRCCRDYGREHPTGCRQLRISAVNKLGGKCSSCGFSDIRALQIDHVKGGGCEEARKLGHVKFIYKNIVDGDVQEGDYQVLCANCNWIKRDELQETGTTNYKATIPESPSWD